MTTGLLYVEQSLSADEEIVHVGNFHWMYTLSAFMSIVWGILGCITIIGIAVYSQAAYGPGIESTSWIGAARETHPGIRLGAFMVFIFGLLRFAHMMIIKATTEIAITTSRLIYKRGLVARYVGEMSIDRIEGVNVLQTILGRILGYGRIMVRGMGIGEVVLPPLENPIAFRKAIETARSS